jgi:hypothetical protein
MPTSRPSTQATAPGQLAVMIPAMIKSALPLTVIHSHDRANTWRLSSDVNICTTPWSWKRRRSARLDVGDAPRRRDFRRFIMEALLGFQVGSWDYATFGALFIISVAFLAVLVFMLGLPGRIAIARKHPN